MLTTILVIIPIIINKNQCYNIYCYNINHTNISNHSYYHYQKSVL